MDTFPDSSIIHEHNSDEIKKQLPVSDSKAAVPNKEMFVKRNKTLDVEKPPGLSRSCSFDSGLSKVDAQDDPSLPPYDPIENYVSPRPKYLRFNPDRHSKILARQENVSRMIKSASFDCGVSFLKEVSGDDCSVEKTEDLVKEPLVSTHEEDEGEKEEVDEVEDGSGGSRNVLLQYLIVVIVLILMTVTICSMNSPTVSNSKVGYKGFDQMMLMDGNPNENRIRSDYEKWDTKDLEPSSYELVEGQHRHTKKGTENEVDVNKDETDEMETRQIEAKKESYIQILGAYLGKPDVNKDNTDEMEPRQIEAEKESYVQIIGAYLGKNDVNNDDTDVIRNPRSMMKEETESRRTEPEKKSYFQIFGAVSGQNDVTEESEIVKPTVEQDGSTNNGPYEIETEGIKDADTQLSKLANFADFSWVVVIILACAGVLYYLIQRITTSAHKNKVSEESTSSVGSGSIHSESSNFEMSSGYSSSRGSFTVEKMIVKKQRSKTPEVTLSTVRRSSRIHNHNRSITHSA